MRQHVRQWTWYDAAAGADRLFELDDHQVVSSRASGVSVLEGPNIDWSAHLDLLEQAIAPAAPAGFVAVVSWWRVAEDPRTDKLLAALPQMRILANNTLLLASQLSPEGLVARALAVHRETGGRASGRWAFGSIADGDHAAKQLVQRFSEYDSPIFAVAGLLDAIGCVVCLDDGLDMMFCRSAGPARDPLRKLAAKLGAIRAEEPLDPR